MASRRRQRGRRADDRGGWGSGSLADPFSLDPRAWLFGGAIVALSLAPLGVMHLLRPGSAASSWLLAVAIYTPCLIFAALTLWFGRATPRRVALVTVGFAVGGLAFAVWAGLTDYGHRAVTLFETEVPGDTPQTLSFAVEHPGVEHILSVWPTGAGPLGARRAVALRVELSDAEGALLLSHEATLEPRTSRSSTDWDAITLNFTATTGGTYLLRIVPLTPGIPRVHVRIADPLKTDGERMPGY